LTDSTTEEGRRKEIIEELNKIDNKYLGDLDLEKASLKEIAGALEKANAEFLKRIILTQQSNEVEKVSSVLGEQLRSRFQNEKNLRMEIAKATGNMISAEDLLSKTTEEMIETYKEAEGAFLDIGGANDVYTNTLNKLLILQNKVKKDEKAIAETRAELKDQTSILSELEKIYGDAVDDSTNELDKNNDELEKNKNLKDQNGDATKKWTQVEVDALNERVNGYETATSGISSTLKSFQNTLNSIFSNINKNSEQAFDITHIRNMANLWIGTMTDISDTWGEVMKGMELQFDKTTGELKMTGQNMIQIIKAVVDTIASIVSSVFSTITESINHETQAQLAIIQTEYEEETKALTKNKEKQIEQLDITYDEEQEMLDEKFENGLISQEDYSTQSSEIEQQRKDQEQFINDTHDQNMEKARKKRIEKENAEEKKQFEANKVNQIAQIWIEAATGIVAAWAGAIQALAWIPAAGPALAIAFGAVLTGLILGFAIAQTVVVSQQTFIPKKARGGRASGLNMINEGISGTGGEMVMLPDNSVVVPADISRQIASQSVGRGGRGSGTTVNVSFAGANISDNMSLRKVSNYVVKDMGRQLALGS